MAPNRRAKNDHHNNNQGGHHQQQNQRNGQQANNGSRAMKCVRPTGCLEPNRMIFKEEIESGDIEVVRVTCNNMQCDQGNFMHLECFTEWEETVLGFLSSTGRARSWSVKQRLQNLWTKKGYDLAFKACDCRCGKGHLRKDLDWISPMEKINRNRNQVAAVRNAAADANNGGNNQQQQNQVQPAVAAGNQGQAGGGEVAQNQNNPVVAPPPPVEVGKKKKKSKAKENLPTLSLSAPVPHPNDNHSRKVACNNIGSASSSASGSFDHSSSSPPSTSSSVPLSSGSIGSNGSSGGSSSFAPLPATHPWGNVADSVLAMRPRLNSLSSNASGSSLGYSGTSGSPPSPGAQFGSPVSASQLFGNAFKFQRKNSNGSGIERTRHNSTGSGFVRRTDFSSFNILPRQKLNSYHIKMEDDGHGNDEMRTVILTVLMNMRVSKVHCCLCHGGLAIYDRYPLVDGTFFLSPRQHGKDSIPMNGNCTEGPQKFLSAVCMNCLEGTAAKLFCRWCTKQWDGSDLVLGGCYNYDIFAATPCCVDRLQCTNCGNMVVPIDKRPNYFSEFSHPLRCDRCGLVDFHLAKPITMLFDREINN